jgi:hypothetical protein
MKKSILTIGLFTIVLASTSFASPKNSTSLISNNADISYINGAGTVESGDNRKVDFVGNTIKKTTLTKVSYINGPGNEDSGDNQKVD